MKRRFLESAADLYDPRRFFLFADDEGGDEGAGGEAAAEGGAEGTVAAQEGAKEGEAAAEGAEAAEGEKAAQEAKDWRDAIKDAEARKLADDSTDIDHLAKRALDMRKKLAKSITLPGKDASEDDVAAFRKAIGVPEAPEGYEFPDLPDGAEVTDDVKASREVWSKRFHEMNIPAQQAKELARLVNEDQAAATAALLKADKEHAASQSAALKEEWGPDYDKNMVFKDRAAQALFGDDLEDVRRLETKDGRFVLDDARFVKLLARYGREMGESSLGGNITEGERDTIQEQVDDLRKKQSEAMSKGDSKTANKLYQQEQDLLKRLGNAPVVGAQGRAA